MNTAIIVEDEPLLRAELRDHLAALWPELQIVAEADNGIQAIRDIERLQPAIVFLDIQIPGLQGLDVAKHIGEATQVVFVTAYAEYAIQAFDAGAADYVLKPINASRLVTTIKRLKLRQGQTQQLSSKVWDDVFAKREANYLKWIKASIADTVRLVMIDEVQYFRAEDKYTRVVTIDAEALIRLSLKQLIEQLDPNQFVQIHRSTIVNLRAIDKLEKDGAGMKLTLRKRPETLVVSESFVKHFRQM